MKFKVDNYDETGIFDAQRNKTTQKQVDRVLEIIHNYNSKIGIHQPISTFDPMVKLILMADNIILKMKEEELSSMKNANQKAEDMLFNCSAHIGAIKSRFVLDPKVTKISHDELLKKMYYALIEYKFEFIIIAENFSNSFCENWNFDEIEFAKFKEMLTKIMQKEVANPLKIDSDKIEGDEFSLNALKASEFD